MECPSCKTQLQSGYGMCGGGMGVYFYCDTCEHFEKFQDPEVQESVDATRQHPTND